MKFGLSTEQRALQDAAMEFLAEQVSLDVVRRCIGGNGETLFKVRTSLQGLGLNAIVIPEDRGGLGLGLLEAALMQEAMGRYLVPFDGMGNTLMVLALNRSRDDERRDYWYERLLKGTATFGVALSHLASVRQGNRVRCEGGRLHGRSMFTLDAPDATHFLVFDDNAGASIVEKAAGGMTVTATETIDRTRAIVTIEFSGVAAEPILASIGSDQFSGNLISAARILTAADTLGAAQRMIEMAVQYSLERKQFGVPIGSFQAVKHMCADMAAEVEPCRALLWYAAFVADTDLPDGPTVACLTKSRLSDVGQFVARTATEVHGGMGFTDELGLHLWFKRIGLSRQLFGGPERLRAEAASRQGWTV